MSSEIVLSKNNIYNQDIVCFNDYIFKNSIEKNEIWEKATVENIVKFIGDGDFLDIGANIGLISIGVVREGKKNQIHCFECDPVTFGLLLHNTKDHKNVKCYPFAVSDKQELCHISRNNYNLGCNFISNSVTEKEEIVYKYDFMEKNLEQINNIVVPSLSLDSISYIFKNKISMVKIDVEGFEMKVLKGGLKLISEHRPVIIVEIWDKNLDEVFQLLSNLNYDILKYTGEQDYICFPKKEIRVINLYEQKIKNEI